MYHEMFSDRRFEMEDWPGVYRLETALYAVLLLKCGELRELDKPELALALRGYLNTPKYVPALVANPVGADLIDKFMATELDCIYNWLRLLPDDLALWRRAKLKERRARVWVDRIVECMHTSNEFRESLDRN